MVREKKALCGNLISVIVPVYNAEKYLRDCILSIINQSFANWELILVDDGSIDCSLELCRHYASGDSRICVLHQENKGVTAARKFGVEHSHGEILCFVDSDDRIDKDALKVMATKMTDDVDIVTTWETVEQKITGTEYVNRLLQKTTNLALWGKLYRKSLVVHSRALDIRREIYIGEDHLGNIRMALHARKVFCLPVAVYDYRDNETSAWHSRNWSLEYEEMLRNAIKAEIYGRISEFEESWYKFQLYVLYDLIRHKVPFSYKRDWIAKLVNDRHKYDLSYRERIVKSIQNQMLCRLVLRIGKCVKDFLNI